MNLTIQVENYVSPFATTLPKITTEDLIYIEKFEVDAYGHWLFGTDNSSLVDKVNGRSLTLQAGATVQPAYGTGYVQLTNDDGSSLQSQLLDSAVTQFTMSCVAMPENTGLSVLIGTLGSSADANGAGLFTSANKVYATVRGGVSSLDSGLALDMAKPVFVSLSVNKTTNVVNFVVQQNGVAYQKTGATTYVDAASPISIGNSRYLSSAIYKSKFYEAIIHDKALSLNEMLLVANRAKIRQEKRGIIF